ncbi:MULTISPECIES: helix-turn-helix transcriptional regulator [unclassified Streptomyces]|uniref:helix-turn-helix domain-containing protein n=1 Tax=unclassified Streptomyces TaxID=2593676 RepID=UPI0034495A32
MDNREEVKAFLSSRRARITPEDAGLTAHGRVRRVPGLRRSEVAGLAGVSVEYYSKLERGDLGGVSESVLHALGQALRLDEAERLHLADLACAAGAPRPARRQPTAQKVRPGVARILDGMSELPAFVHNGRLDVLAANTLAEALFAPVFADPARPVNHARFNFLNPRARDFWLDWERAADNSVALLRTEAGRDPYTRALTDLVGELSTRSEAFRVRWASHDVHLHRTGLKHIHHPVVGVLHLFYEVFDLAADPGLALVVFSAEAGSSNDDALRLLASWAATHDPADALARPDQT